MSDGDEEPCPCALCRLSWFIAEAWIDIEVTGIEELPDKERGSAERRRP